MKLLKMNFIGFYNEWYANYYDWASGELLEQIDCSNLIEYHKKYYNGVYMTKVGHSIVLNDDFKYTVRQVVEVRQETIRFTELYITRI